jgi:cardiolipin synthase
MLNLPNLLSIGRILCAPLFIILLLNQNYGWALFTFAIAALTDAADGLLARLLKQRTVLGTYLDPAADKLLNASSYITLAILNLLPSWLAVIVVSRDVIICLGLMILFWTSHALEIRPSIASKLTTGFQFCYIVFALWSAYVAPAPNLLLFLLLLFLKWGTAIGTVVSGLQYIGRGVKIFNP